MLMYIYVGSFTRWDESVLHLVILDCIQTTYMYGMLCICKIHIPNIRTYTYVRAMLLIYVCAEQNPETLLEGAD